MSSRALSTRPKISQSHYKAPDVNAASTSFKCGYGAHIDLRSRRWRHVLGYVRVPCIRIHFTLDSRPHSFLHFQVPDISKPGSPQSPLIALLALARAFVIHLLVWYRGLQYRRRQHHQSSREQSRFSCHPSSYPITFHQSPKFGRGFIGTFPTYLLELTHISWPDGACAEPDTHGTLLQS